MPVRWNELWEMLPEMVQVRVGWTPPLPLIPGARNYASNHAKALRLADHIAWAQDHRVWTGSAHFCEGRPKPNGTTSMTDFVIRLIETQRLTRIYEQKQAALAELKKSLLHQAFYVNL